MAKKPSSGGKRRPASPSPSQPKAKTPAAKPKAAASPRAAAPPAAAQDPVLVEKAAPFEVDAYKFVLTPTPPAPEFRVPDYEYLGELPNAYGTRRLWLVARDTHFLFAYWDFTDEQLGELAGRAGDGNVYLQLHQADGAKLQQIHVLGGLRHWYLHANRPGASFYAELGIYHADGRWEAAARSGTIAAPRNTPSPRTDARFATLPFHLSFRELLELIRHQLRPGEELAEGLARLQQEGFAFPYEVARDGAVVPARGEAISGRLAEEIVRRTQVGSLDVTEILRRRLAEETSSGLRPNLPGSPSSPFGASFARERDFFMHVNAELIVYGGTHPGAKVRINGQPVELRPDGTFTFHFNFPDGNFHIPIEASSPDAVENRSALLSFLRLSATQGEVTATPQSPRSEPLGRTK
jgi:hypothetical protein